MNIDDAVSSAVNERMLLAIASARGKAFAILLNPDTKVVKVGTNMENAVGVAFDSVQHPTWMDAAVEAAVQFVGK